MSTSTSLVAVFWVSLTIAVSCPFALAQQPELPGARVQSVGAVAASQTRALTKEAIADLRQNPAQVEQISDFLGWTPLRQSQWVDAQIKEAKQAAREISSYEARIARLQAGLKALPKNEEALGDAVEAEAEARRDAAELVPELVGAKDFELSKGGAEAFEIAMRYHMARMDQVDIAGGFSKYDEHLKQIRSLEEALGAKRRDLANKVFTLLLLKPVVDGLVRWNDQRFQRMHLRALSIKAERCGPSCTGIGVRQPGAPRPSGERKLGGSGAGDGSSTSAPESSTATSGSSEAVSGGSKAAKQEAPTEPQREKQPPQERQAPQKERQPSVKIGGPT